LTIARAKTPGRGWSQALCAKRRNRSVALFRVHVRTSLLNRNLNNCRAITLLPHSTQTNLPPRLALTALGNEPPTSHSSDVPGFACAFRESNSLSILKRHNAVRPSATFASAELFSIRTKCREIL
jgi:hypothetical protein